MFFQDLFQTFIEFLYAPLIYPTMLWIVIPVILAILLMELYFHKYPREGIGHHKSLENTVFLLFISFDLIRYIIINNPIQIKTYITGIFVIGAIIISAMDFLHKLPTHLIFNSSSKLIIAYFSYITIILVYSDILTPFSVLHAITIILSIALFLLTIFMVKKFMMALEPRSYAELEHFLKSVEQDVKKTVQKVDDELKAPDYKKKKK